jgi:ABC-type antimicrobial peptide transport system permease subunit
MSGLGLLSLLSLMILLLFVGAIFLFGALRPYVIQTGIKLLKRSAKLNLALICATCISTLVITGSLIAGDSLNGTINQAAFDNLNEVDEIITSDDLFNGSIAEQLRANTALMEEVDHISPIIYIQGIAESPGTGAVTKNTQIIGFDQGFFDFGSLKTVKGENLDNLPEADEVYVNEELAAELELKVGDKLNLTFSRLDQVYEAIFLGSQESTNLWLQFTVSEIVTSEGLGRFQLNANRRAPQNVYVSLETMQKVIGTSEGVNTILVSNKGDVKEGAESCDEVSLILKEVLNDILGSEDAGLTLSENTDKGYVKLEAENVFFSYSYYELLDGDSSLDITDSSPILTYFFNSLSIENQSVYYSTVTAFDPILDSRFGLFQVNGTSQEVQGELRENEIIINNWTAERLGAGEGDILTMNYSIMDDFYNIRYHTQNFTVKYVVDMVGKAKDSMLMPSFPGIEGEISVFDWDPPFPMEISKITDDDERYWRNYGGTPKAFVSLETGIRLWKTDIGNITQVRIIPDESTNLSAFSEQVKLHLNDHIGMAETSISVKSVKSDALDSVEGIEIFTQMFLAFGASCIIASAVLIILLITLRIENRMSEIGTLRALGFKKGTINHIFLVEGAILSIVGGVLGVVMGFLFGFFLISGMNSFWSSIMESQPVEFFYTLDSLVLGFTTGIIISLFTMAIAIHHEGRKTIVRSVKQLPHQIEGKKGLYYSIALFFIGLIILLSTGLSGVKIQSEFGLVALGLAPVLMIISSRGIVHFQRKRNIDHFAGFTIFIYTLYIMYFFVDHVPIILLFFTSGFMLLCGFLLAFNHYLRKIEGEPSEELEKISKQRKRKWLTYFAKRNAARRPKRTMFTVFLFSLTLFVLVSLTVNLQGVIYDVERQVAEGGGGYQIMGESTNPIYANLADSDSRAAANIDSQVFFELEVEQFKTKGDVQGTCSNLNRQASPRIIGANESFLQDNSFVFTSHENLNGEDNPWMLLQKTDENGDIPAVGDYNTIVWILGLDVGSKISVENENGETVNLKIVGIIGNSIFQGTLIVWDENFNLMYPTKGGYLLFLFKSQSNNLKSQINELERALGDFGFDAYSVESLVIENILVENTYISIFQVLLLLGLIIGTLGFGIVASRNALERRREIGILRAIGFSQKMIFKSLLFENSYIILWGMALGTFAGIIASSAYLIKTNIAITSWPWPYILALLAVSYTAAIISAIIPIYNSSKMSVAKAIRISE